MKDKYNVAIVGSTGAVGQEMISILNERKFPLGELRLIASSRSAGKEQEVNGKPITIKELDHDCFDGIDIAFFSAGASRSREFAASAVNAGAVVIDNSSAFRLDDNVPLIVPEINPGDISEHKKTGIIANPNCTTAVAVMALKPLHDLAVIKRVVATSFQAVSGAGAGGISELENQTRAWAGSGEMESSTFPHPIAFNVIPHIDVFQDNSYTKEEMKFYLESRKILGDDNIQLTATTVRVPVFRAHSISVNIETENEISVDNAKEALSEFPGVKVVDDPENSVYPMPIDAAGKDDCLVGRIRVDYTTEKGLSFWVVGDQLRKGAALNAIQIAELYISENA